MFRRFIHRNSIVKNSPLIPVKIKQRPIPIDGCEVLAHEEFKLEELKRRMFPRKFGKSDFWISYDRGQLFSSKAN